MVPHDTEARDDYLASQIARLDDEMETLRNVMCTKISDGVEAGIMRAVSSPELWTAAIDAIQTQAKQRAGGWLLGGISSIFSRLGWVILAVMAVYALGGWTAVSAMVKNLVSPVQL